jgi:hypothetical protein
LNQGGAENFRYNFALVETGGGSPTVNVQVFDGSGGQLGQKSFTLSPFEQLQPNVAEVVPGFSSVNARLTTTVTGGTGSVILAGAQLANASQDSSGFEMSFRDELLGAGAGVTSLNGLAGALTLTPGNGISITPSGSSIAIAFTGGGSSGITSVTHDTSLAGAGTGPSPLGIAAGQVVRSVNGLHDAVTLAAGSNVTLTPSGSTITIAATGSGTGGLAAVSHDATLAGNGTGGSPLGVAVPLTLENPGNTVIHAITSGGDNELVAIFGEANSGGASGIHGKSLIADGVWGEADSGIGVEADSTTGIGLFAFSQKSIALRALAGGQVAGTFPDAGVRGESLAKLGVLGLSGSSIAVEGSTVSGPEGVLGTNSSTAVDSAGILGIDGTGGSSQTGSVSVGVRGESKSHVGVQGLTDTGLAGVRGLNGSSSPNTSGVFGRDGTGLAGVSAFSAGVRGESNTNIGVVGLSGNFGVVGALKSGVQGELGSHRTQDWGLFTNSDIHGANGVFTGTLTATNLKSFVEPHPTDATKEIRFVCLEGPESGTYFRGHGHVVSGFAKIEVPESFRMVTDDQGLTVVAMPVGGLAVLACVKKSLNTIVLQGSSDVEFDYVVNGVRKAYKDFKPIADNHSFIPDGPNDQRFALYAPEIQRRLVATGIYNADGTVNRETARRLGWDKEWADPATK